MNLGKRKLAIFAMALGALWSAYNPLGAKVATAQSLDTGEIVRFDPINDRYVPVTADDLRVGFIYRRFDGQRGREVWAFYQGDGRFSLVLGEGSVQPAYLLDIRASRAEAAEALRRIAPLLAEEMEKPGGGGGRVFARIDAENEWELYGLFGVPTIFNPDTGFRWERQGMHYIPVSHTAGYRWAVQSGTLIPFAQHASTRPTTASCPIRAIEPVP